MSQEGDVVQSSGSMDILTALQEVLKRCLKHDGLARGLHEGAKALDRRGAFLCVLASDVDEPQYQKLVKALCAEHNIALVMVPKAEQLGQWAGLCKVDREGRPRNIVNCGCVVVKDYGEESDALSVLLEHIKIKKVTTIA